VTNKTSYTTNGHRTKCPTFQTAQIMFNNTRKKSTMNWGRTISSNTQNLLAEAPQLNRQRELQFCNLTAKKKIQVQFSSTLWTAAESTPFAPINQMPKQNFGI
jgi:hypothetical protein